MNRSAARRPHVLAVTALLAFTAAACGSSASRTDPSTPTPSTTPTPTPSGTDPAPTYPTAADVALVRVGRDGNLAQLLIGGDGWVYYPSAESPPTRGSTSNSASGFSASKHATTRPAAIPAPPAPIPVERRRLTPEGVDIVMALADQLGLLAVPGEYADPGVTDMSTTEVTLVDENGTYVHSAYALGWDDETGNRKNLADFVDGVLDIETLVGNDNIGPSEVYVATTFSVSTNGSYYSSDGPADWPTGVPVAQGCIQLPVDRFPDGVAGLYIATVDGTLTRVSVVPDLPGDECT